jgi:hypothetical protein
MKLKFTFLLVAFLLSGLINTFAQIEFTTAEGYVDGELNIQAPTGGMTWTVPATGFLVNATAGTVSIADEAAWGVAKYNQPFSFTTDNFSVAIKFSFDRNDIGAGNQPVIAVRLVDAINSGQTSNQITLEFVRVVNTNYRLHGFVKVPGGTSHSKNSANFAESTIGLGEADASSDDLTLKLTIQKGVDKSSWTAMGKLFNGTTEIMSVEFNPFELNDEFHTSASYYPSFIAAKQVADTKIINRTVKTFSVSPLQPMGDPSGIDVLGTDAAAIYPNPVVDVLNISSSDFTNIEIFNITGKLVKSAQLNSSPVNVSELAKGVYLVRLIGSTTAISKFVKK